MAYIFLKERGFPPCPILLKQSKARTYIASKRLRLIEPVGHLPTATFPRKGKQVLSPATI